MMYWRWLARNIRSLYSKRVQSCKPGISIFFVGRSEIRIYLMMFEYRRATHITTYCRSALAGSPFRRLLVTDIVRQQTHLAQTPQDASDHIDAYSRVINRCAASLRSYQHCSLQ